MLMATSLSVLTCTTPPTANCPLPPSTSSPPYWLSATSVWDTTQKCMNKPTTADIIIVTRSIISETFKFLNDKNSALGNHAYSRKGSVVTNVKSSLELCMFVCLSISLFVCLSVCLFVYQSVCLSRPMDSESLLKSLSSFISLNPDIHQLPTTTLKHLLLVYTVSSNLWQIFRIFYLSRSLLFIGLFTQQPLITTCTYTYINTRLLSAMRVCVCVCVCVCVYHVYFTISLAVLAQWCSSVVWVGPV